MFNKIKQVLFVLILFGFCFLCACQPASEQEKPSGEGASSQHSESAGEAEPGTPDTVTERSGESQSSENETAQLSENEIEQIEAYFNKNLKVWLEQERPLLDASQYDEPCDFTLIDVIAFEETNETARMRQMETYKEYEDTLKAVTVNVILMPNNETTAQLAMALGAHPESDGVRSDYPDARIPDGAFRLHKVGFIAQEGSEWICELTATGF